VRLSPRDRLIVALDFERLTPALQLARRLAGRVGMFKIGKQLFTVEGPEAVRKIAALGAGVFLDLKFHDIPNTVAGAVTAACGLPGVRLITLHTLGGREMMKAAAEAAARVRNGPKLLGVTVLTSMAEDDLSAVGILGPVGKRVRRLAALAERAGLDGVVASPREIELVRRACSRRFLVVTPGVRPAAASRRDDQRRTATPAEAIRAGADYLVIGRPILEADNPVRAAEEILKEIEHATRA
jgi:orotidine-5'-phosphate decarboxylase